MDTADLEIKILALRPGDILVLSPKGDRQLSLDAQRRIYEGTRQFLDDRGFDDVPVIINELAMSILRKEDQP